MRPMRPWRCANAHSCASNLKVRVTYKHTSKRNDEIGHTAVWVRKRNRKKWSCGSAVAYRHEKVQVKTWVRAYARHDDNGLCARVSRSIYQVHNRAWLCVSVDVPMALCGVASCVRCASFMYARALARSRPCVCLFWKVNKLQLFNGKSNGSSASAHSHTLRHILNAHRTGLSEII